FARSLCDARRCLRQAIDDSDFAQIHLAYRPLHQRLRTERTRHYPSAQRAQVEPSKVRVLHFSEKHRRHTVDGSATLPLDGFKHLSSIEEFYGAKAGPMRIRPENAYHATEAVEKRHAQTEAITVRIAKASAQPVAVVDDVPA